MRLIQILFFVLVTSFYSFSQITDLGRGTMELIEIVEDVVKKVQDYNHHQLEGGDQTINEKFTLQFEKMEKIHRGINDVLMSGELNDILAMVESVDRIRGSINDLAKKYRLPKLEQLTKNPINAEFRDFFDLGELGLTERFRISDLTPLDEHRGNETNLENFSIQTKINQAVELFQDAGELTKKAAVIDRDLSTTKIRDFVVDAIGAEILDFSIQDYIIDMLSESLTNCDGDIEYDDFIIAAENLARAQTDLKEAEISGIGISESTAQKAITKTNFDFAKTKYYQCKNTAGDDKRKIEIMKDAVRELVELLLFIYGIDVSMVFKGLTESVEEPLLIMNDAQRLETMEIRNEQITGSMEKAKEAVQLLKEAAESTHISKDNLSYKEKKIYTNILTTF